jgi:predicted ATPase/DNA-binding CsgD family transcriptional regulator
MPRSDPSPNGNVPVELTSFVGRRRELTRVKRLLGEYRLVTLTGVGGTGKTRLAVRVANQLWRAFPDGVCFVDLTALRAPELLALELQDPQVLAYLVMPVLGLREQPGAGSPTDQLVGYLAGRRVLLVLDNCEHLLPVVAVLVDTLLRGCPGLRVVATSREPLLVAGETLFQVPPLPVPEPGTQVSVAGADRYPSVALFVARARAASSGFALTGENMPVVAELCRRLDGLPLAIELAAARVRVLAPADILQRLGGRFALLGRGSRGVPQRQQTLRACVDWSFELCCKRERVLWARASVFVGGFELDAVEEVCADELVPEAELLEVVTGLVDKSVLVSETVGGVVRYRMLETIRDYGQEKLTDARERDELRRRHRDWYRRLARRFEVDMISSRQPDWFARVDRELPNLRAAMDYSLADPDEAEPAVAIPAGLYMYWLVRGLHREGRSRLDQALARHSDVTMTPVTALYAGAVLASLQGDLPAVSTRARQGYEAAERLGDARAHAIATSTDGVLARTRGDLAEAARLSGQAVAGLAGEQAGELLSWRVRALAAVALVKGMLGDVDGAAAGHESVLAICRPRGESFYSGFAMYSLGLGLWKRGDPRAAAARLRKGLRLLRRVNDALGTGWCLDALAWIAYDEGRSERAATLLGAVTGLAHAMGARAGILPELAAYHEQHEQRTRDALGEPAYQAAFARGEHMSLDEAVGYALDETPPGTTPAPSADPCAVLTRRERQVADLIAGGLSNKEIAAKLVISQRTAESHVEHILTKLGVTNRAQVAAWMAQQRSDDNPDS